MLGLIVASLIAGIATPGCGSPRALPPLRAHDQPPEPEPASAALVNGSGTDTHGMLADPTGWPAARRDCPTFASRGPRFAVQDPRLLEVSGIVMASPPANHFWMHNDSGDAARMLAVGDDGVLAELQLPGVDVFDAEDIALARGLAGQAAWLYLADIGDNLLQREAGVLILRTPEPQLPTGPRDQRLTADRVERLRLRYESGPRDAEAFLVDPVRHDLIVITKGRDGVNLVLTAPESAFAAGEAVATIAARLELGLVTAADITLDGRLILVRTYTDAWVWLRDMDASVAETLAGPACKVPTLAEPQSESAAWGHDGSAYFTLSEGDAQPLNQFARQPRAPTPL